MLICHLVHLVHLVPLDHNMVLVDQLSSVKQLQGEQYLSLIKNSDVLIFFCGKLTRFSGAYFALQIHNISQVRHLSSAYMHSFYLKMKQVIFLGQDHHVVSH